MKLLTLNFLTCALKSCKSSPASFPLHPRDAVLEITESEPNIAFLRNILPRLMWEELRGLASELGLPELPSTPPSREDLVDGNAAEAEAASDSEVSISQVGRDLHRLLLETGIAEGVLVCAVCGHEYQVKEGVANFLLPGHLV
ncbi:hypothetical protein B0J11DRAFT_520398 [Dendryphion nanum]|uniref:Trm112p-domain-containing protein n=1 Tax=Dendryphion nanum TaxID=256645 RepID=A0A9P9ISS0_9PLEO|nr:hypothetical protein B0J11DRAFT_520398 [Dendryphion nanum]